MSVLEKPFKKMGARAAVTVNPPTHRRWGGLNPQNSFELTSPVTLDIRRDENGEYFDIRINPELKAEISVLDVQPKDRHLLLLARYPSGHQNDFVKRKFLCGHDETHWFVAAIPETVPVSNVAQAKLALKPDAVRIAERSYGVPVKATNKRRNAAFKRQGEWFFLPVNIEFDKLLVLKTEPFSRGRGKSHYAEEAVRKGGRNVWVGPRNQVFDGNLPLSITGAERAKFTIRTADAKLYVRGRITHADHRTIVLDGWHEVVMNNEPRNVGVLFLD